MRPAIPALATLLSLSGCLHDDDARAFSTAANGTYELTSRISLTLDTVLPQPVEDAVETLREFSSNPADTMFSLAASAGVPAVDTVRDYLPGYVEDKLDGWINDEVATLTLDGVPVTEVAATFGEIAETTLTQISLESELVLDDGSATHRLTALDLAPMGIDQRFALGSLPAEIVTADATASTSKDTVKLDGHGFTVAYGEYAWRALDTAWTAQHGSGLRTSLGAAVGCADLASHVATRCVLGECVGHRSELTEICEAGLDELVQQLHAQVAALRFEAIHIRSGAAHVTSEGLVNGVWNVEVNAGQGLRRVPGTFTATRNER
ncbi:hypothetical protein BH11MYX3_BH11MYX3_33020 [soil metagenome]